MASGDRVFADHTCRLRIDPITGLLRPQRGRLNPPTEISKGLRLGSFVLIRDVIEDELEQAFAGKKSAKAAMDSAVTRGNELLRRFEAANK